MTPKLRLCEMDELSKYVDHCFRIYEQRGIGDVNFHAYPLDMKRDHAEYMDKLKPKWATEPFCANSQITWGVFVDQRIVGSLCLVSGTIESQLHRVTLGIVVEPEYRSQGWGRQLMMASIDWAKRNERIDWIDLHVFAKNLAALALYEKLGFHRNGILEDSTRLEGQSITEIRLSLNVSATVIES